MNINIRPVGYSHEMFAPLLSEAQAQGFTFLDRLRDEWLDGTMRFDRRGEILFGAFVKPDLIGVGGITLDPYSSEPSLGRLRHLYVLDRFRGRGVGRNLVKHILSHARSRFGCVRLFTGRPEAARLYESVGFAPTLAYKETHRLYFQTSFTSRP